MEATLEGANVVHRVKPGRKPKVIAALVVDNASQAYALRVWQGQSVDVPRHERIERVLSALRGQNMLTDNIIFP